jgi:hypothetical protein
MDATDNKMMDVNADWPAIRERHRAFWTRGTADHPLAGAKRTTAFTLGDYEFPITDRPLAPQDVDIPQARAWAEALYCSGDGFLDGELVWGAPPLPGIPWMEAILGCPIWVSKESGSLWAAPCLRDWEEIERAFPLSSNPWFLILQELTDALVRQADGRYPVTQTLMRGTADVIAALRGHEQICLDFYDNPAQVRELARRCTDAWIEVAQAQFRLLRPFDGGYTAPRLEVWSPGQLVRFEEDASILFSRRVYRDFIRECDRRIASSFDYAMIHTHSADCKIIPDLTEIEELPSIQVLVDPSGPTVDELIPVFQQIQAAGKALLITHELTDDEMEPILEALSPRGLALERMRSL